MEAIEKAIKLEDLYFDFDTYEIYDKETVEQYYRDQKEEYCLEATFEEWRMEEPDIYTMGEFVNELCNDTIQESKRKDAEGLAHTMELWGTVYQQIQKYPHAEKEMYDLIKATFEKL